MKLTTCIIWIGLISALSLVVPFHLFAQTSIIDNPKVMTEIIQLGVTLVLVIGSFVGYSYYAEWKEEQRKNHLHKQDFD